MALSDIDDILADFPGWTTDFQLKSYDETSKTQGGDTLVKARGTPLWNLTATSRTLRPNELDYWRARLESLDAGKRPFWGYSLSRCYPIAYPNGSWPGTFDGVSATIASLGSDNKSLSLAGLPSGFTLAVGDMFSFPYTSQPRYALHRVEEAATAASNGTTGTFEVRPFIQAGAAVGDVVSVKQPRCLMMLVPGSISSTAELQTGTGTVSFQGVQIPREF